MVHTLETIAIGRFLNLPELEAFAKNSDIAKNLMNDDGTVSTWYVDDFVDQARKAGVSREIPKIFKV